MAQWPSFARFLLSGFSESADPSIERTEMERGPPKMAAINSRAMVTLSGNIVFFSADDIAAFEDWYYNEIKRVRQFDFRHPRTGQVVQARVKELGAITPETGGYGIATLRVAIEYLR